MRKTYSLGESHSGASCSAVAVLTVAVLLVAVMCAAEATADSVAPLVNRLPANRQAVPASATVAYASPGPVAAAVGDVPASASPTLPTGSVYGPLTIEQSVTVYPPGAMVDVYEPLATEPWHLQVLPDGLIYRSYLAGVKEPRFASVWNHDIHQGWIWDISLGGRVGLLRYGTTDPIWPDGVQVDVEGAALLRLDPEADRDLVATDYRFGIPLTYGRGPFKLKFGYYHLSSHLGDEYMLRYPDMRRDNYVHDSLVLGESVYLTDALRLYGEVAWAFYSSGRAKPWEFQFGLEYSPAIVNGLRGAPFFALNTHLREEFDFEGNLVVQVGWQWRGTSGQLARVGVQYFNGRSDMWQFDLYEQKVGMGLWYDY